MFGDDMIVRRNSKAFSVALLLIVVLVFLRFGECGKKRDMAFGQADQALCTWFDGDAQVASETARDALRLSPDTGWLAFVFRVTALPDTEPGPFHESDEMLAHFRQHRGFTGNEEVQAAIAALIQEHAQMQVTESREIGWRRVADRLATCGAAPTP